MSNTLLSTTIALLLGFMPLVSFAADTTTKNQPQAKPAETNQKLFIPPVTPALDKMHLNNSNAYALDMLRNFNRDAADKNLIFSPTSLQFVLGMLGSASNNSDLLKQLNFAWHEPSSINIEAINEQLALRLKYLQQPANSKQPSPRLNLANGLFINKQYKINPAYQTSIANYDAQISNLDFTKWNAVPTINQWVNKHTQGQIPKIIDKLQDPKNTSMVITNAIAFEGQWPKDYFQTKYTKWMPFTGIHGKKSVLTMRQEHLKQYYEDDNLQAIYIPYEGFQNALFILLPKSEEKEALDNLLSKLDIDYFNNISNGFFNAPQGTRYQGTLFLPRFKIAYDNQTLLEKSKELLGIDLNPLTNPAATFNRALLNEDKQPLSLTVSKMAHKAVIEVNEKGTKAAAVTHAELALTSAAPAPLKTVDFTMKVNRPFIYGVMDSQQQLLFLGTVKSLP